ncbi:vomeronasal type-1 receptor 3-like [Tupaia chinensis]|uniref:vomeronasal type-1 receptor 3-like n=1 Tax=Tupaia chinensis TaxID=246437 RepID=UPI000703C3F3|nr:vomeronasal type-1 receptor 3-like [Tupaia chinensis]
MASSDLTVGIIFLSQTIVGFLGNFFLLYHYINIHVLLYMSGKCNCKNSTKKIDYGYCSGAVSSSTVQPVHYSLLLSYDVLCLVLMIWARSSMVFILLRHKQRVQHIHGTSPSPRPSPESRITQSILVLVSTFVSFLTLSSILSLYLSLSHKPSWWLVNTSALITSCYPTISPFVFMSHDPRISRLNYAC